MERAFYRQKTGSNALRAAGGTPEAHPLETLALWLLAGMAAIGAPG